MKKTIKTATLLSLGVLLISPGLVLAETVSSTSSSSLVARTDATTVASSAMSQESKTATSVVSSTSQTSATETTSSSLPVVTETSSSTTASSTAASQVKKELKTSLNLAKLRQKDFSSLVGTWKDGFGAVITITKDGHIYTQGANGGYLIISDLAKQLPDNQLRFALTSQPTGGEAGQLTIVALGQEFPSQSTQAGKDLTDKTKDRLVIGEAYEPGKEKAVFYRLVPELSETNPVTVPSQSESSSTSTEPSSTAASQSSSITSDQSNSTPTATSTSTTQTETTTDEQTVSVTPQAIGTGSTTRVKRVLPKTGEQASVGLTLVGLLSLVTGTALYKRRS